MVSNVCAQLFDPRSSLDGIHPPSFRDATFTYDLISALFAESIIGSTVNVSGLEFSSLLNAPFKVWYLKIVAHTNTHPAGA